MTGTGTVARDRAPAAYDALAAVYDRWTADTDYDRWTDFVVGRLAAAGAATGARVLDVCCGTGSMTFRLHQRGFAVTGVDGSQAMLDVARQRVENGTPLVELTLPASLPFPDGSFDAAVCCFDSLNYLAPEALGGFFAAVATVVRPGGAFVFDLNSRRKLETVFGNSHYGDDLGDFAYVWRNRYDPGSRSIEFLISIFTRSGDGFRRQEERHRQWWFEGDTVRRSATAAGFEVLDVTADYTSEPLGADTLRETWTLRRAG